jgi:hypothetical protein
MRTFVRAAALLVGVVVAALLIAAAVVQLPMIQRWAAAQVAAQLPRGISIGRAALTVFPPGVRLSEVSLAPGETQLAAITCHVRLSALLAGRIEVTAVTVEGAEISIERNADGTLRVTSPLAALLRSAPDNSPGGPSTDALSTLPSVAVHNGTLTLVDQVGHGGVQTLQLTAVRCTIGAAASGVLPVSFAAHFEPAGLIDANGSVREVPGAAGHDADYAVDITATASGVDSHTILSYLAAIIPGGGTARAQGELQASAHVTGTLGVGLSGQASLTQPSGSVLWDDVALGAPLTFNTQFNLSGGALALSQGQLGIEHLAAARLAGSTLQAGFAYADGVLHVNKARASAYGGTWTQSGTVTLSDPPRYDLNVRADNVGCVPLLTAITGERPEFGCEFFNAEASVRGPWTGPDTMAAQAEGSGRLELRGGTVPSSSIIGEIWQAIVPRLATSSNRRHIGAPTRVDRLTESFALRGGQMRTNDLSLVTDDYTVSGHGSIGLDGSLDLDTDVMLTPAGVGKLLTMSALPIPSSVPNMPPIRTRITGSIGSPNIRPDAERLPLTLVRGLFGGAVGAAQVFTDAAGEGLEGVRRGLESLW